MAQGTRRRLSFESIPESTDGWVCELCGQANTNMSSPGSWKDNPSVAFTSSLRISSDSLVCRPCRHDISRILKEPGTVPRWEKPKKGGKCFFPNCGESSFTSTKKPIPTEYQLVNVPIPTPLCKHHYFLITNKEQSTRCLTCNISLRHTAVRTCPDVKCIQQHLLETGCEVTIPEGGKVCLACYKSHLQVLKTSKPVSTNADLSAIISCLKTESIKSTNVKNLSDAINGAMQCTMHLRWRSATG